MNEDERKNHSYIGDGVYAQWDGFGFWLRANHHTDEQCTDKIYIEPSVLNSLNQFHEHLTRKNDE
jgi:hypothetical protein